MAKRKQRDAFGTDYSDDLDLDDFEENCIMNFDDIPVHLKMAIYGDTGTFKTRTTALTSPSPFLLDCNDRGTLSIRGNNVKGAHIKSIRDLERAYWYLAERPHKYKTVIWDTTTELLWIAIAECKDSLVPSQRNYGEAAEIINQWITNFKGLPMHVIFICQERRKDNDEDDDDVIIFPDLTPKVKSRLYQAVDIVGRMFIKEVKGKPVPALQVGPHEFWKTKERSGVLKPRIIKPSISEIIELINSPESKLLKKKSKKKRKEK